MDSDKSKHAEAIDLPHGIFERIEYQINANQELLKQVEENLRDSVARCGRWSMAFRATSIFLAAVIPFTQIKDSTQGLHFEAMPLVACGLGIASAVVSGLQALLKLEAKTQGARVLAALSEAKRQNVVIEAVRIRVIPCPRIKFGEAMGLLTFQHGCLEQIRSKATELELSLPLDERDLSVCLEGDYSETEMDKLDYMPSNQTLRSKVRITPPHRSKVAS